MGGISRRCHLAHRTHELVSDWCNQQVQTGQRAGSLSRALLTVVADCLAYQIGRRTSAVSGSTRLPRQRVLTKASQRRCAGGSRPEKGARKGGKEHVKEGAESDGGLPPLGGSPSATKEMEHHQHMGSPVMHHQKRSEDQPWAGPQFLASPCSFRLPVKGGCNVWLLPSFLPLAPLERPERNACSPPFGSPGKMKQEPYDTRTPPRPISTSCPIKFTVPHKRRP
jgi:hypothetical protein